MEWAPLYDDQSANVFGSACSILPHRPWISLQSIVMVPSAHAVALKSNLVSNGRAPCRIPDLRCRMKEIDLQRHRAIGAQNAPEWIATVPSHVTGKSKA